MKLMQRLIIVLFASLLMCMQGAWAADRGALFKVSAKGHTMHLFGTMHVGLPEFYPLEPRIAGAVDGASVLALEIDPLADPAAMAQAIASLATRDPVNGGAMPPGLQPRLDKALRASYVDPAAVAGFKPWLIATIMSMNEFALQGGRPDLSVDLHLAKLAKARNIPILELESMTSQLGLFNRLSPAQQWVFLEDTVAVIESGRQKADVAQIMGSWAKADQAGLDAIALRAEQDTTVSGKFVQEVLLDERNGPLADKLAALLAKQDKAVAAIGVLHLVGKNSVVAKLRARGISVERIY